MKSKITNNLTSLCFAFILLFGSVSFVLPASLPEAYAASDIVPVVVPDSAVTQDTVPVD